MKRPTSDDLYLASEWLRQYDDSHDGGADTARLAAVADWLDRTAYEADLRGLAREAGAPVAALRKKLAQHAKSAHKET